MTKEKEIKYIDAMSRIQDILRKFEANQENADIDTLIMDVEEAASLITICRQKLVDTEAKIKNVLEDLDETSDN